MSMLIKAVRRQLATLSLGLTAVLWLGTHCNQANADTTPWSKLTPLQQEALAPLETAWDSLEEKQQKRLLATTKKFRELDADKKQRYHKNLLNWTKLSPEQRKRAREKYKAFRKIPAEKQEEIKRMVLKQEAEKDMEFSKDYKDETPEDSSENDETDRN